MRRVLIGGIAAVVVLGGVLGLPLTASAHALAQSSDPPAGAVLQQPPSAVTITFGEEPDPKLSSIDVLDSSGQSYASAPAQQVPGSAHQLRVALRPLPKGIYTVGWRTLSAVDGHRAAGSFAFGVQVVPGAVTTANAAAASTGDSGRPSALAVAARWGFYLGLIALLGAAFVGAVVLPVPPWSSVAMCLVAWPLAAVGTVVVTVAQANDAGAGWGQLLDTTLGHALLVRGVPVLVAGAAVSGALTWRRHRRPALIAVAATAAAAMLGDVLEGHAAAGSAEAVSVALQWVHIAAGGIWLGGLAALLLAVRGAPGEAKSRAVRRFSFSAALALAAVLGSGITRAVIEISSWGNVLTTDFGRLVIAKLVLIAALAGLGAVNRWRNVPAAPRRLSGLRRVGSMELGVAGLAILTAAALVNVAPPASAASPSPPPAAPPPLVVTASDYATTVRLRLEISPGTAGFNTFAARLTTYDTGSAVTATDIQLSFSFPLRPDLGDSTLILKPTSPGTFAATGGNLSLDGVWSVTALVERGTLSKDVQFTLATRTAQKVDVSSAPGQPTLYTVHLAGGRSAQWYLDPQTPGRDEVHVTFFDASGNGYPADHGIIAALPEGGVISILPTRQLDPGHYVGDATLQKGNYRFDVLATGPDGNPISSHIDIGVGS